MESRIKKKAATYAFAAILITTILAAAILNFGTEIQIFPPASPPKPAATSAFLSRFTSAEQLKNFLGRNSGTQGPFVLYGTWDVTMASLGVINKATLDATSGIPTYERSTTNVQVEGVDETDTVKSDSQGHMYVLSGNVVTILKAYPPENAAGLSRIVLDNLYPRGIFVDGDQLVILGVDYNPQTSYYRYYPTYYSENRKTFVRIYDIHDRSSPVLLRDLRLTGSYLNSRMIGKYVYYVVFQAAYVVNETINLPTITSNGQTAEVPATEVRYCNGSESYYQFTTFTALNIEDVTESPTYLTIMLGSASGMYVSLQNIYVTFQDFTGNSTIYRVRMQGNNMTCEAKGKVFGHTINQFSMDEYNNYFRIATTGWKNGTQQNNVYVLDMNLTVVGKLENLASGEFFHSARFMGNRCYLVTFKKTDPLFTINLTEPTNPKVLGELKIPGYSDYLHPYDETHLIGVGKETVEAEQGDFAWYQGIKISLFDVTNITNPTQMYIYIIGERGSQSPVLDEEGHKAFLFDKTKNLLVIPALEARIDRSQYPGEVPPYAYGNPVFQGAYVFDVSLYHGFVLKGRITHVDYEADLGNEMYWVRRSLYIEEVLYTVSDKKVRMNNLEDLKPRGEIPLS
jgi:uncharacterized secreted protein with C-terminal beta-propeller domain